MRLARLVNYHSGFQNGVRVFRDNQTTSDRDFYSPREQTEAVEMGEEPAGCKASNLPYSQKLSVAIRWPRKYPWKTLFASAVSSLMTSAQGTVALLIQNKK